MRGSRALDVALSLALLPVAALAALPLALAVFLDSPGTVLFRSPRLGREGRPFAMLKFRTMRTGPARLRGGGAAARHVADREGAYLESILPLKVQIDLRYVETEGSIVGDLIYVGRTALLPFQRVAARVWTSLTGPRPAPAGLDALRRPRGQRGAAGRHAQEALGLYVESMRDRGQPLGREIVRQPLVDVGRPEVGYVVVVPLHRELAKGTLNRILKDAGLSRHELRRLL